jgi:hypoxanthine-DNA glycosylase
METLFRPVFVADAYEDRVKALSSCGVGIWDIFASCIRLSSLDADISHGTFNDFSMLRKLAPNLKRVVFNGKVAAKALLQISALGYQTCTLPSTSPAYTIAFASKLKLWCEAMSDNT